MRKALPCHIHSNLDVAYDAWAPVEPGNGSIPDDKKKEWLKNLADIKICEDYQTFFNTWQAGLEGDDTLTAEFTLESHLLIGHGEPSATEVGLKVHHTWGVPVIPGSALKGLLHHYLTITYQEEDAFRDVEREGGRIVKGPGKAVYTLFGGPEAQGEGPTDKAAAGFVTFHDALYIPNSMQGNKPYAVDVLTVHQKSYYDKKGEKPPNDYDSPNPIGFLSLKPGTKFLVALSGPQDLIEFALNHLDIALKEWGIGGKTSAGYGRLTSNWEEEERERQEEKARQEAMETPEGRWRLELINKSEQQILDLVRRNLDPEKEKPEGEELAEPAERCAFAIAVQVMGYVDRWKQGQTETNTGAKKLKEYARFVINTLEKCREKQSN